MVRCGFRKNYSRTSARKRSNDEARMTNVEGMIK
jgi:hypothetical protein